MTFHWEDSNSSQLIPSPKIYRSTSTLCYLWELFPLNFYSTRAVYKWGKAWAVKLQNATYFNIKLLYKEDTFKRAGSTESGVPLLLCIWCKRKSFSEPLEVLAGLFIMCSCVCPSSNSNAQTFLPDPERKTTVAKWKRLIRCKHDTETQMVWKKGK